MSEKEQQKHISARYEVLSTDRFRSRAALIVSVGMMLSPGGGAQTSRVTGLWSQRITKCSTKGQILQSQLVDYKQLASWGDKYGLGSGRAACPRCRTE